MAHSSESITTSSAVQRVAQSFRRIGWVSFWIQAVLSVISAIVLLFSAFSLRTAPGAVTPGVVTPGGVTPGVPAATNPETGIGLFLAVCGLIVLVGGAGWAFQYTMLARKLRAPEGQARPKRGDAIQSLRWGLWINLLGMLLTILGSQAIVGSLVAKSFAQGVAIFSGNPLRFINPLDVFLVQANINIIMGHFIGLVATLWLVRSVSRQ